VKLRPVDNPPNPYSSQHAEWLEPPPLARVEVYEESSRSVLTHNTSPDLPFAWSVNPYRGCQHACSYCYARRYHEYLGLGAGTDFDTKIVAKINAPQLLRKALHRTTWKNDTVEFSGVTDCYQPIEASYGITRRCLEVCLELGNPVAVTTKGFLVVRDAHLLGELEARSGAHVYVSIPFADATTSRLFEPQAPPPERRFEIIRRLRRAGVPVGVLVSPLIPGLNDRDIPILLERAAESGATSASFSLLRLSGSVEPVFVRRLCEVLPLRARGILDLLRGMRDGAVDSPVFFQRMEGSGAHWGAVASLFEISKKRFGLDGPANIGRPARDRTKSRATSHNKTPSTDGQLTLDFGG